MPENVGSYYSLSFKQAQSVFSVWSTCRFARSYTATDSTQFQFLPKKEPHLAHFARTPDGVVLWGNM